MCRVDYYEDDSVCLHPPAPREARKEHRCDDCGRTIEKGETYTYGYWTEPGSVKMCGHCIAAGQWLNTTCGGHLYPGVLEELDERWDEGYRSTAMAWLLALGRRQWRRHGDLIPVADVAALVDRALASSATSATSPLRIEP